MDNEKINNPIFLERMATIDKVYFERIGSLLDLIKKSAVNIINSSQESGFIDDLEQIVRNMEHCLVSSSDSVITQIRNYKVQKFQNKKIKYEVLYEEPGYATPGALIRNFRKQAHLTQTDLANLWEYSSRTIHRRENNSAESRRESARKDTLTRVLETFDIYPIDKIEKVKYIILHK